METALALLIAIYFGVSIYMMLSKFTIRIVLGIAMLSNGVNLVIFTAGRLVREVPPIIPEDALVPMTLTANPLPQALILTAIVISFSFFAFLMVLTFRSYQALGTDNSVEMRVAEPREEPLPPLGY